MFSRALGMPLLLAASVGVPYAVTNVPDLGRHWQNLANPTTTNLSENQLPSSDYRQHFKPAADGPGSVLYEGTAPLEGYPRLSLGEVFNLQITKEWIYQHWARKTTALSELGMQGIRVPLVTGTQLHDLAGSLTYYFGPNGRLQRISFRGTTGDTTPLVSLVTQQFGFVPQQTPVVGEQLYQVKRGEDVLSELRTEPASVLWANSPHDSFRVELNLQRPETARPLPTPMERLPVGQQIAAEANRAEQEAAARREQEKQAEANADPREKWNVLFPRSRVPKEQVRGLDRRERFW